MIKAGYSIILLCFLTFIISSCAGISIVDKSTIKPNVGKSIVYGKITGIRKIASGGINIYNSKRKNYEQLVLKRTPIEWETEKFVAYELEPGEYELISYDFFNNQSRYTGYWVSDRGYSALKQLGKQPSENDFNKADHDKIIVPPNQIIYFGEWELHNLFPIIIDNRISNDAEIIKIFPKLDIKNAITIIPEISLQKFTNN